MSTGRRTTRPAPGRVARSAGRTLLVAALASATHAVSVPGLDAQEQSTRQRAERGWIGVSFELTGNRRERAPVILITDVSAGSPAQAAGLRAGDRVLAINEVRRPEELASLSEILQLRTGDEVVIEIERDGQRRMLRLHAAPRPSGFYPSRRVEISMEADSLVETWSRSMDSMRVELTQAEGGNFRVRAFRPTQGVPRVTGVSGESDRVVRTPFEFFVFRGEAHDSLQREMVELNRLVVEIEDRIGERERDLRLRFGARDRRVTADSQLRGLRSELERASDRSVQLMTAMAEAARATAGFEYGLAPAPAIGNENDERPAIAGEFRPLTPYLLGRNRVAGAEVIDLRPELAEYFEVTNGVLVTDVAPGTPAAIAGLVPGDVITRIDQVVIRSVEDLRLGVSRADDALPLTLIRQGASRQVLLRR
ncbi:MAG: PDZ domain-containing protein [Gemmatimonadota bacterium]|nr:PDZ domain-containing protein [Gemmatimonadota bacterium]